MQRAHRERQDKLQLLRAQRMEDIGALASGIVHDLNNAVGPGTLTVSMLRPGLSAEQQRLLDAIEQSFQRQAETNGKIAYAGELYDNDQTFTAQVGQASSLSHPLEFQATGDAQVFVHDRSRHAALKRGFTNEWVMFIEAKRYHPSPTSIWKSDAYSD